MPKVVRGGKVVHLPYKGKENSNGLDANRAKQRRAANRTPSGRKAQISRAKRGA